MTRCLAFAFFSLFFLVLADRPAEGASLNDDVVLRNGDIHAGTVAQEVFGLETAYGRVEIPYGLIARIFFGGKKLRMDRLVTIFGERFTGKIRERELFVLRDVLGPSLPVSVDDIARIEFAPRKLRPNLAATKQMVLFTNGDRFKVQFLTGDIMIKTSDGLKLLPIGDIAALDFDANEEGDLIRVQVRLNKDREIFIGAMLNTSLNLRNHYGQAVSTRLGLIESVVFNQLVTFNPAIPSAGKNGKFIQDRFDDDTTGPLMIALPTGSYRRGDLQGTGDSDEKPTHTVRLSKPFAIGMHPVTFEEYDRFSEEFGRARPADEGWGRGRRPVINVSWEDAVAYAKWLSRKTGYTYRLPTDSEWEFAARAGGQTRYFWGDKPGRLMANCSQCGSLWDGEKTAPVGKFPPNPFGLYDMAGNVWEWMEDCYHDKLSGFPTDGSALQKKGCGKRVIRGGAWSFPPKEMRSANRWRDFPTRRSDDTGFRLVRELE